MTCSKNDETGKEYERRIGGQFHSPILTCQSCRFVWNSTEHFHDKVECDNEYAKLHVDKFLKEILEE